MEKFLINNEKEFYGFISYLRSSGIININNIPNYYNKPYNYNTYDDYYRYNSYYPNPYLITSRPETTYNMDRYINDLIEYMKPKKYPCVIILNFKNIIDLEENIIFVYPDDFGVSTVRNLKLQKIYKD